MDTSADANLTWDDDGVLVFRWPPRFTTPFAYDDDDEALEDKEQVAKNMEAWESLRYKVGRVPVHFPPPLPPPQRVPVAKKKLGKAERVTKKKV